MSRIESLKNTVEILEGETLKGMAESSLHHLSGNSMGRFAIELACGGERVNDPRLATPLAGMVLENPLLVGAGWDKKGSAVDGLYYLGFAGTEVGSVLTYYQPGNPKPRLWIDKYTRSVGLNRLGFNSPGMSVVAGNLSRQQRLGITGISIGKNKFVPDKFAPEAHAQVADRLHDLADYFVINVASPNTPGLRGLLKKEPLTDIVRAVKEVLDRKGDKPLFVKSTVDLALQDLDAVLDVCVLEGVDGIIDTNTTVAEIIKSKYGWENQAGGVSGNDHDFRQKAVIRMRYITRETRGTGLQRVGVGAINNAESALERIQAGAQALQVVTAIREHKGRVARQTNLGLLKIMDRDGVKNITEYIGTTA